MAPAQRVSARQPKDVRAEFDLAFRRFSQSMDMLLPDQRALAYNADLRWLGKIRGTARARYRDDRLDLAGCGEKVRQLIADAVVADGIQILVKEVQLFSPEFEEKVEALKTDEAKASEMEHAIRHEINVRVEENPAFYQSLRERLEEIIEQQRLERLDAAKQLSLLNSLREELKGEQARAQDMGLDGRGFAIYGLLERQRPMAEGGDSTSYNPANRRNRPRFDGWPLSHLVRELTGNWGPLSNSHRGKEEFAGPPSHGCLPVNTRSSFLRIIPGVGSFQSA